VPHPDSIGASNGVDPNDVDSLKEGKNRRKPTKLVQSDEGAV
jgi:hypothetical protein